MPGCGLECDRPRLAPRMIDVGVGVEIVAEPVEVAGKAVRTGAVEALNPTVRRRTMRVGAGRRRGKRVGAGPRRVMGVGAVLELRAKVRREPGPATTILDPTHGHREKVRPTGVGERRRVVTAHGTGLGPVSGKQGIEAVGRARRSGPTTRERSDP